MTGYFRKLTKSFSHFSVIVKDVLSTLAMRQGHARNILDEEKINVNVYERIPNVRGTIVDDYTACV